MAYNIYTTEPLSENISADTWSSTYKNTFLNNSYDRSQLNLMLPDDCLVVLGAPRLKDAETSEMYPIGFLQSISYSENRQVQPLKTIGSRRHVFSATNTPVQGSIARLLLLGPNLMNILHHYQDIPASIAAASNQTYKAGTVNGTDGSTGEWYTNAEEDLFRVPFGMGIIYNAPSSLASKLGTAAEYIENCVLVNKQVSIQSGQAVIMEQVSFMADRVVGWSNYKN